MRSVPLCLLLVACPTVSVLEGDDAEECRDRADNDGDGLFDCDDEGCDGSPDCEPETVDDDDDAEVPTAPDVDRLLADVTLLAADDLAGRLPGTPGNDLATEHVAQRFSDLGLEPAGDGDWFRAFDFNRWEQTSPTAFAVEGDVWEEGRDHALFRGSAGGVVNAEMVFVGYGFSAPPYDPALYPDCPLPSEGFDEYEGVDVTGKIALVLRHGPGGDRDTHEACPSPGDPTDGSPSGSTEVLWRFTYKTTNARDHGAAAMVLVPGYHMSAQESFGGALPQEAWSPDFPAVYLDRDRLEAALPELPSWAAAIDDGLVPASRSTGVSASISASSEFVDQTSRDVVGAIVGGDPERRDEVVLVGAHIDHLGPGDGDAFNGADDNASGSAVLLELARLMAGRETAPARTVVFASFNAEEMGLIGSCDYAADPSVAYPMADLVSMVSVDMVGAGDATGLEIHGGAEGPGRDILTLMRARRDAAGLPLEVIAEEASGRSDHACFAEGGVPAVLATTPGEHPDYHQPSDETDGIDPNDLQAAADLLWLWLQAAADGADR